jgi:Mg2+-importing ATPase
VSAGPATRPTASEASAWQPIPGRDAAALPVGEVLRRLGADLGGLPSAECARRRARVGANAVRTHRARALPVLLRQVRSPLLLLLAVTAVASFFVGEHTDAVIIAVILSVSVGLGFVNEYRAERAAEALHDQMRHRSTVLRDGTPVSVDVVDLVPGDVVLLQRGEVVPADLRLLDVAGLECIESVLTGEAVPTTKQTEPVPPGSAVADASSCAWMGTVASAGTGRGVVSSTGRDTEFGSIAAGLGERHSETEFQVGLRQFSMLLVKVAAVLTTGILAVNLALHRPLLDAMLFSLAIAVGISPQLLPAVVSTSLAAGTRALARRKVLVKRLVSIEDLGDVEVLFTDKTGTLTEGRVEFMRAVRADGSAADDVLALGLLCTELAVAGPGVEAKDPVDAALWAAPGAPTAAVRGRTRLDLLPFDHDRRRESVLVADSGGEPLLVTKGAPESVLAVCTAVPDRAAAVLQGEFEAGHRVVAVASARRPGLTALGPADEAGLELAGFLVFADPPKSSARPALQRLHDLGVRVKVITGDHPTVAVTVCRALGLEPGGVLTGTDLAAMDDDELDRHIEGTTIFARVDPAQKARIVRAQRRVGRDVAFLGDGVNDALALHAADVGVAVDGGTDVAKDAADVVLLERDLGVLADGITEGRRIFANTIKYVLMGTSSNFGNMFSAAGASALLSFLPMLPSQILLNNLLYDTSQLAIPTDTVDEEQLARPSHWDVALIRRFMLVFGPISSVFDFATFGVMLWVFDAHAALFRSGWFVESLATQTLVLFVIRTRRSPFTRSRPSVPLLLSTVTVVAVGAILPATPLAGQLGFSILPGRFFVALALMVVAYLALVELVKRWFYRRLLPTAAPRTRTPGHRIHRRATRFSSTDRVTGEGWAGGHLFMY